MNIIDGPFGVLLLLQSEGEEIAKIAMARKLAVHLYWMLRRGWDYGQLEELSSHAESPEIPMLGR